MCRVAGIIHPDHAAAALEKMTGEMCDLLIHGGPDDGGVVSFKEDHLSLGNRRLSLLDLTSAGHQPMQYGGRYTITYNGELYNYNTIKQELKAAGMSFNNNTDTEVILAAFAKWNTKSFSLLNGMFAFALWDNETKTIYIVRDTAGIKPLYYSTHTGGLTFASEIRAFAPVPYLQDAADNTAVYQLSYGFIPEPVTTLKYVKSLPKGCFLSYNSISKKYNLESFSFFSFTEKITDKATAIAETRTKIADAVTRQMIADAPVGVFLSGGIDSSLIALLADERKEKELHTLSIWFNETNYSEKRYQDIIAKQLRSRHHSILLTETDFHNNFPAFLDAMDMPGCDGFNTWFISKFAVAEGLKAVLSGIGADELYGGYPSFGRMKQALMIQKMPGVVLAAAKSTGVKKLSRTSYLKIDGMRGLYLFLRGHFTPSEIAAQTGAYEKDIWTILNEQPASPVLSGIGEGNTASWLEFNYYMQDQLLRDADVMSMANSLEIRVPFLDNEVIQSAFSISEEIKFKNDNKKELLIKAFEDKLPKEIWQRKKMGFTFPFAQWLRNNEMLKQLESDKNPGTRKAYKDFMSGKLHWSRVMSLIILKNKGIVLSD